MKKIIPPGLFLICILLMVLLKIIFPLFEFINYPLNLFGVGLILMGLVISVAVRKHFDKIGTEIHTFKIPRKLAISGLFKLSRNPIYFAFMIALIGVSFVLNNSLSLLGVLLFGLVAQYYYIPFEEKKLNQEFGIEYRKYKKSVRRWL